MINLSAAALTDMGLVRAINEDSVWAQVYTASNNEPVGLFVVCDGMGGHLGGEFASYWALEAIKREMADLFIPRDPRATVVLTAEDIAAVRSGQMISRRSTGIALEEKIHEAIRKANSVVCEYATRKPDKASNAGTTVTMAVVHGEQATIVNAGDSRTYLVRDHELKQITRDHSMVANLVKNGKISPDEIYDHPQRNVIFRFLGQQGVVNMDIYRQVLQPGDYLLLCSDGLWEMIHSAETITRLIEEAENPRIACLDLVEAANAGGGEDNIGVVVAKVT